MFGLTTWIRLGVGAAIVAALIWTHTTAYRAGGQSERQAVLERSVDILRERAKTDEDVRSLDDAALCRSLGGLPDECAKLGM